MSLRGRGLRRVPWRARYVWGQRAMTEARKLGIRLTHLHANVVFQGPVRLGPGFRLSIPDAGTLIVGPGVDFRGGFVCVIEGNGRVMIGANTTFTSHALIHCATSIEIGERCVFGQSLLMVDGYHRYSDPDVHWLDQGYDYRPLKIGDGVGVSDKCTVQADIGERAMVASQSVVDRPIPAYCTAAGSPARVVRYFGPEGKDPRRKAGEAPQPETTKPS